MKNLPIFHQKGLVKIVYRNNSIVYKPYVIYKHKWRGLWWKIKYTIFRTEISKAYYYALDKGAENQGWSFETPNKERAEKLLNECIAKFDLENQKRFGHTATQIEDIKL